MNVPDPYPSQPHHNHRLRLFLSVEKIILLISLLPLLHALPLKNQFNEQPSPSPMEPSQINVTYLVVSVSLVILGGIFAGLTLGLMGQDEVYLKVISSSGSDDERKLAEKVLKLFSHGKHQILVTLLLSNVITNETLPIVLDRSLNGGGWQAVVFSTILIVIFGEIIPQSTCVKYGLQVGAFFGPFVIVLMYTFFPIVYPTARLLDYILGESHGTMYKKSGLKTLVTLHKTMGVERLSQDEVTIISAVLDLKEKSVFEVMTPMENVYTMSADTILDSHRIQHIFNSGFSRIPIHLPNDPTNFIGMLLVRVLISYDSDDKLQVSHFPLATLPETRPTTSCLNILNYFQEGKSHMCVVSNNPGSSQGAIGVVTLEDVIEELIGEEIIDESDVFIDIHNRIKRDSPPPLLSKRHMTPYLHQLYNNANAMANSPDLHALNTRPPSSNNSTTSFPPFKHSPPQHNHNSNPDDQHHILHDTQFQDIKPSNPASNPLKVKKSFVTIKNLPNDSDDDSNNTRSNYGSIKQKKINTVSDIKWKNQNTTDESSIPKITKHSQPVNIVIPSQSNVVNTPNAKQIQIVQKKSSQHIIPISAADDNDVPPSQTIDPSGANLSYKSITNGIVESIITVKGVSKTIIEPNDNASINSGNSSVS
ncbi:hypothetical protein TBLA_0F00810 [Henningerozyma blattae CBS 6284]|uniref:CNNM transmembrane domain-containing protein n=1 Tax=Henningerozyma blattae (strain ATCC 34711 / CBS 6284 / DSM 70876 / NBRC 10599 / NRRL Y-10934 / UCD 77-7) TaxID=1071380 RepID=I2H5H3_HENB6|nr:hypothetical protein TBLA_0F00810 [Tetrapisispora blattae CBS 6284]CCH61625.1 hypothetical protein TBLA_0F00810 [Tetrapisispora blattae CBS 6284]